MSRSSLCVWLAASISGCGATPAVPPQPTARAPSASAPTLPTAPPTPGDIIWADATALPGAAAQLEPLAAELIASCSDRPAALSAVALRAAERLAMGQPMPDTAELTYVLRAGGGPQVWLRAWTLSGGKVDDATLRERAGRWLSSRPTPYPRACGVAIVRGDAQDAAVVLTADAMVELAPLPTRARAGQWLTVDAKLRVPATGAKVVVLGPRGAPKPVPTQVSGASVRARFAPDAPGSFLVQLLADVDGGPRPVAEAWVHADVQPPSAFHVTPAPGESAGDGVAKDDDALTRIINAARAAEGIAPLTRDRRLDALADAHAQAMRAAGTLGHDVGSGGPEARVRAAGLSPRAFGENVAHAASIPRAHRAVWASPSHRSNVLDTRFRALGIGVAWDGEMVWVCEIFADFR